MFCQLFKRSEVVNRYFSSPLSEARLHYLAHWAERGASNKTLKTIARCQLAFVDLLDLGAQPSRIFTIKKVKAAANRLRRYGPKSKTGSISASYSATFIRHAVNWLSFMGRLHVPPTPTHPLASQIAAFADYMRDDRGLATATIQDRCGEVRRFLAEICGQHLTLAQVTADHIDNVLIQRVKRHAYSRRTVQRQADSLRAFFRYAERRDWCQPRLALAIRAPRIYRDETLPRGPSWEEVQRLLAGSEGDRPTNIRDRAILLLLAVYGLRVGEVCRLRLDALTGKRRPCL